MIIRVDNYIRPEWIHEIIEAKEIRAARALLEAGEAKRNEVRKENEENPRRDNQNLKKDIIFKLGMIEGLNWVLELPNSAREYIKTKVEGG